ncbi:MAG: hypothetical protein KJO65_10665 [Gemmatimonadetes bacterium]|nr:hypothetical protein [Gemmatimonadota bacterium]
MRVLHTLRKLAREIHRRSVWQVVAGYTLFWFLAHRLVVALTDLLGLPLWTPSMAFSLLAIGLPIVLATTVAQGGLPGLRIEDVVDPNELEGLTPEDVHVIPEAHPLYGVTFLTWRNAILGGVMAAALLVTSVVAYLTMWAFGIGPVGSLAAQGIIEPDDVVYVALFEDETGETELGGRVRRLMEVELSRSTLVDVMDRSAGDVGTAALVIDGEVRPAEGGYRVYARIRMPDGMVLAGFGRTAETEDALADAVGEIALRLRERFGESLREIHEDEGRGR